MDPALERFVGQAVEADAVVWDEQAVRDLASKVAPAELGGLANWLLRGDANHLWVRVFSRDP